MYPDQTPKEWDQARALLVHRLGKLEEKLQCLEKEIGRNRELISELRIKVYGISAGIATLVGLIGVILSHFGITIGKK